MYIISIMNKYIWAYVIGKNKETKCENSFHEVWNF